jgi:diguanylate cyclase (GGDEF)-like protein
MTQLVDQLADLTALRDRDALDAALVSTLSELLHPMRMEIHRLVGPSYDQRWLSCLLMKDGVIHAAANQTWIELEELPPANQFPRRQAALEQHQPVNGESVNARIFPLATQSASSGVLEIFSHERMTDEAMRLVSAVLRLYQNFQGLLDYGERDALTELLNRKTFDGAFMKATTAQFQMPEAIANDRRHVDRGGNYWLALLDIDHFKRVNDNFGHLIGDEVLILLARLMRDTFRFHDQLYRFGGEEFVVLMHCAEEGQAQVGLERLRQLTASHAFPQVGQITVSIGFTEIQHGDTPSAAFERADKAVYYAKAHGRNQVAGYEVLVKRGELAADAVNLGDIELF